MESCNSIYKNSWVWLIFIWPMTTNPYPNIRTGLSGFPHVFFYIIQFSHNFDFMTQWIFTWRAVPISCLLTYCNLNTGYWHSRVYYIYCQITIYYLNEIRFSPLLRVLKVNIRNSCHLLMRAWFPPTRQTNPFVNMDIIIKSCIQRAKDSAITTLQSQENWKFSSLANNNKF